VSGRAESVAPHEAWVSPPSRSAVLVDHTTSRPSLAVDIFKQAKALGIASIDAPVSGGDVGAREGKLVVMCGGEQDALDRVRPIL
jgi:3-hydroxyisobutyrate dehydrogenase